MCLNYGSKGESDLEQEEKGFRPWRSERIGFGTLYLKTQGKWTKLSRICHFWPIGQIVGRLACLVADGWPMARPCGRWTSNALV